MLVEVIRQVFMIMFRQGVLLARVIERSCSPSQKKVEMGCAEEAMEKNVLYEQQTETKHSIGELQGQAVTNAKITCKGKQREIEV